MAGIYPYALPSIIAFAPLLVLSLAVIFLGFYRRNFSLLYIFSDGVYEVEKSDGSMRHFEEFADFMNKIKMDSHSKLDLLYQHAKNIGNQDNFEDDFTKMEVAFG